MVATKPLTGFNGVIRLAVLLVTYGNRAKGTGQFS